MDNKRIKAITENVVADTIESLDHYIPNEPYKVEGPLGDRLSKSLHTVIQSAIEAHFKDGMGYRIKLGRKYRFINTEVFGEAISVEKYPVGVVLNIDGDCRRYDAVVRFEELSGIKEVYSSVKDTVRLYNLDDEDMWTIIPVDD